MGAPTRIALPDKSLNRSGEWLRNLRLEVAAAAPVTDANMSAQHGRSSATGRSATLCRRGTTGRRGDTHDQSGHDTGQNNDHASLPERDLF